MNAKYERDLAEWSRAQASLLRSKQFDKLDLDNLAEEIESIAKVEKRRITNFAISLLSEMLTLPVQSAARDRASLEIRYLRLELSNALQESPSLTCIWSDEDWMAWTWQLVLIKAQQKTGLGSESFPKRCEWTIDQIQAHDWMPSSADPSGSPDGNSLGL